MVSAISYTFYVCYHYNFVLFPYIVSDASSNYSYYYYQNPISRAPSYLIGIIIGLLYKEAEFEEIEGRKNAKYVPKEIFNKLRIKLLHNKWLRYLFYALGIFWIHFLIYVPNEVTYYNKVWLPVYQWIFITFSKSFFIFGLICITIHGLLRMDDIVVCFLKWPIWKLISKLSFCAYLIHVMVIHRSIYSYRVSNIFSTQSLFYWAAKDIIITLFLSFLLHIFVEKPLTNIEKSFHNIPKIFKSLLRMEFMKKRRVNKK